MGDDGEAEVQNPIGEVDAEEQATPQRVQKGMRALGIDGRYNLEKIDLRGIKQAESYVIPRIILRVLRDPPRRRGDTIASMAWSA